MTKIITVFGGSGFIGRSVVRALHAGGYSVRVATRRGLLNAKECNNDLGLDQDAYNDPFGRSFYRDIEGVVADCTDKDAVAAAVKGADAVINLVGISRQHPSWKRKCNSSFQTSNIIAVETIAKETSAAGIQTLIHTSALGSKVKSFSEYFRSKALGETALLDSFPNASIIRPSVVFGEHDSFLNKFAYTTDKLPFVAVFGRGTSMMQPVWVEDLARAFVHLVETPVDYATQHAKRNEALVEALTVLDQANKDETCVGIRNPRALVSRLRALPNIYELGGPHQYWIKDIIQYVMDVTGKQKHILNLNMNIAASLGNVLNCLENPPFTRDHVLSLVYDTTVSSPYADSWDRLCSFPLASIDDVAPSYLPRFENNEKKQLLTRAEQRRHDVLERRKNAKKIEGDSTVSGTSKPSSVSTS